MHTSRLVHSRDLRREVLFDHMALHTQLWCQHAVINSEFLRQNRERLGNRIAFHTILRAPRVDLTTDKVVKRVAVCGEKVGGRAPHGRL